VRSNRWERPSAWLGSRAAVRGVPALRRAHDSDLVHDRPSAEGLLRQRTLIGEHGDQTPFGILSRSGFHRRARSCARPHWPPPRAGRADSPAAAGTARRATRHRLGRRRGVGEGTQPLAILVDTPQRRIGIQRQFCALRVRYLRYQAAIGQRRGFSVTETPGLHIRRQRPLDGLESHCDPVSYPLLALRVAEPQAELR